MAVAAYKQIGWVGFQLGQHALGIAWRAPADVGHPNLHPSSNKVRVFRVRPPRDVIVDVAKDGPARRHFGQGICHVERPYVTCMPHFIRPFNMPQDPRVNVPVRVRKEGDVHGKDDVQVSQAEFCPKHPNFHAMMMRRWTRFCVVCCAMMLSPGIWSQTGPSRKAKKAYDEALEAYRFQAYSITAAAIDKALRKSPDYADAWFLKAQLHRDLEKEDVAEVLEYALLLDGDKFPFGWVELAQIQWESGQYAKGLATLAALDAKALPLTEEVQEKRQWVEAGLRHSVAAMSRSGHRRSRGCLKEASTLRLRSTTGRWISQGAEWSSPGTALRTRLN